jgi:F0F1-type ATP synthase assembly protein I
MARLAGIGWYVAISIAGGALAGAWLDRQLGTGPVLLLVGLGVGLLVALLGMMRLLRSFAAGGDDAGDAG